MTQINFCLVKNCVFGKSMIFVWQINDDNSGSPISGRVDRASATEAVDSSSIPGGVEPNTKELICTSFLVIV